VDSGPSNSVEFLLSFPVLISEQLPLLSPKSNRVCEDFLELFLFFSNVWSSMHVLCAFSRGELVPLLRGVKAE
jgi:hypothetical protein